MNSARKPKFSQQVRGAGSSNNVHLLLDRLSTEIEAVFDKGDRNIQFERSLNLLKLISEIYKDEEVPAGARYKDLVRLEEGIVALMWEIRPRIPESAPELWRDRTNKNENPYEFVYRVYADCLDILTKNEIEKLDKSLSNRLLDYDKINGKKHKMYIKNKREHEEAFVNEASWDLIVKKVSPEVRDLMRYYSTKKSRPKK